jgi:hypothetical protein
MIPFAMDPGSLDRLHDIVVSPPVPWLPPAPVWYVVGAFSMLSLAVAAWRVTAYWLRNRYRRAALVELDAIEKRGPRTQRTAALAELVKRVALAAYSRERVASVSGSEWLAFLDASGQTDQFVRGDGRILTTCYDPQPGEAGPGLFAAVRHWIRHHRADFPC